VTPTRRGRARRRRVHGHRHPRDRGAGRAAGSRRLHRVRDPVIFRPHLARLPRTAPTAFIMSLSLRPPTHPVRTGLLAAGFDATAALTRRIALDSKRLDWERPTQSRCWRTHGSAVVRCSSPSSAPGAAAPAAGR
jgi:hypothetical protein